jgi:hypothetical protein
MKNFCIDQDAAACISAAGAFYFLVSTFGENAFNSAQAKLNERCSTQKVWDHYCIKNDVSKEFISDYASRKETWHICDTGERWRISDENGHFCILNEYLNRFLGVNGGSALAFYDDCNSEVRAQWIFDRSFWEDVCIRSVDNAYYLSDNGYLYSKCNAGEKWDIFSVDDIEYQDVIYVNTPHPAIPWPMLMIAMFVLVLLILIITIVLCKKNAYKNKRNGYDNVKCVDSDDIDSEAEPINV